MAQQPVGMRRHGHAVHVGPGADTQRGGAAGQLGGELEVTQSLRGHPQAHGRPADGEMCRAARLRARVGKSQCAGGSPVAAGGAPLDELRRPQRDHASER